ncbi:hypothetical protein ACIGO8_33090 [Streptomyces sp. NPDC053493]|uniref:hypothetical protein n=1 Tax=Streptomyces sp. NPDC053493 TaxID=3365705 RepID=UPI0037D7E296
MDTSETNRLISVDLQPMYEALFTAAGRPVTIALPALQDIAQVALAPIANEAAAAIDRAFRDSVGAAYISQQLTQGVSTASYAIEEALDLSWLQGSLAHVSEAALPRDWFSQQVQGIYASDWLGALVDGGPPEQPVEVPSETLVDLRASAEAFQQEVAYLPLGEQKKLFLAFVCAIVVALGLLLAVAVQDQGEASDILGSVSDIIGVAGTVAPLAMLAWDRRRGHTREGDDAETPEPR